MSVYILFLIIITSTIILILLEDNEYFNTYNLKEMNPNARMTIDKLNKLNKINKSNKNNRENNIIVKVYHMDNCSHCTKLIKNVDSNGMTVLEKIQKYYPNIKVEKYEYGVDKEADEFNAFPMIIIEKHYKVNKISKYEYNGERNADELIKFINNLL
jgi:hypothetical protein